MQTRLAIALGLAVLSLALAATFGILTALCGGMEQGSSVNVAANQTTSYGPRCVPAFHPMVPLWASFAVVGAVGIWKSQAWIATLLGLVGLGFGIISGFSAGFFGIGCGALLLASGLVAPRRVT